MYTYKIDINGNLFDFTPLNSSNLSIEYIELEFPFSGKTIELNSDVKFTKASVSSILFQGIKSFLIDSNSTICYLNIYNDSNQIVHQEWFNGYNLEIDNDNYLYTITTKPLNDFVKILRNLDTEFNIYKEIKNDTEITVESPPYYTGNFQGCIPVVEVLKYIGSRFFDNYAGFESKLLTGDSYVTKNNRHSGLYITHISNAREAIDNASYSKATIFNVTVRQILEYIAHTYDVLFKFENGIFKALEMHEIRDIDISNDVAINLLTLNEKYSRNKNKYIYTTDQFPERQRLSYKSYNSDFFSDALIQYDPNEAIHSDKAEEVREIGVVTDIYGIYANESNFGQDDAVVLQVDPNTENELFYDNIDNTIFFNSTYSNSNGEFSISDENKGNNFNLIFRDGQDTDNVLQSNSIYSSAGGKNIIISDNNFVVTTGDTVGVSYWETDILYDLPNDPTQGLDNVNSSEHFKIRCYIGDADSIEDGVPSSVSSQVYTVGYRLADFNTLDRTKLKFEGHVSFTLTATANSNNAVIVFEVYQGKTNMGVYTLTRGGDKLEYRNKDVYYKSTELRNINIYLFQTISFANYDLRPSNLLRTFHTASMYFLRGNIESSVGADNGALTAYSTKKIKQGEPFTIPIGDIAQMNFDGAVVSAIGNDGEIKEATYNLNTKNLTVTAVYDKNIAGGNDIVFFSFFRQVGLSIIDYDAKTVTATISREGDITNVTSQKWEFSYKAIAFPVATDFSEPVQLPVMSATGEVEIWTIYINVSYLLSIQLKRNDNTTVDVFKITTSGGEIGNIYTDIDPNFYLNSNSVSAGTSQGFVNYNISDESLVTELECEINQDSIDLSILENLVKFSATSTATPDTNQNDDILLNDITFTDNEMSELIIDDHELTTLDGLKMQDSCTLSVKNNDFSSLQLHEILKYFAFNAINNANIDISENKACAQRIYRGGAISSWQYSNITTELGDLFEINDGRGIVMRITSTSGNEPTSWAVENGGNVDTWQYEDPLGRPILCYADFNGSSDVLSVGYNILDSYTYEWYGKFNKTANYSYQCFGCLSDDSNGSAGRMCGGIKYDPVADKGYYFFLIGDLSFDIVFDYAEYDFTYKKFTIKEKKFFVDDVLIFDGSNANFSSGTSNFAIGASSVPGGHQWYCDINLCWFKINLSSSSRVFMPKDSVSNGMVYYNNDSRTFTNASLIGGGDVNVNNFTAINSQGEEIIPLISTPFHDILFENSGSIGLEIFDND